jgi:molecular chaperone GrpE
MSDDRKDKNQDMKEDAGAVREIPVGGEEGSPTADVPSDTATVEPDPVDVLNARVAELEDQRLRALAEVDNTRKRLNRQMDEALRSANDRLLVELLEVIDNFDRALKHTDGNGSSDDVKAIRSGMELIYTQMLGVLSRYDVRPMESVGRVFDPTYHEALAHIESDDFDEGVVAAEINRGYMIGARVLRHARVAVSKGASKEPDADKKDN